MFSSKTCEKSILTPFSLSPFSSSPVVVATFSHHCVLWRETQFRLPIKKHSNKHFLPPEWSQSQRQSHSRGLCLGEGTHSFLRTYVLMRLLHLSGSIKNLCDRICVLGSYMASLLRSCENYNPHIRCGSLFAASTQPLASSLRARGHTTQGGAKWHSCGLTARRTRQHHNVVSPHSIWPWQRLTRERSRGREHWPGRGGKPYLAFAGAWRAVAVFCNERLFVVSLNFHLF